VMEFIAQGDLEAALTKLQQDLGYDYILIDSAPVCSSSETALLAATIKSLLWVVRPGMSQRFPLQKATTQLSRHGVQWLGMIINGTEASMDKIAYEKHKNQRNSAENATIN
jgi:polysaccharide biosynthesis transport protein